MAEVKSIRRDTYTGLDTDKALVTANIGDTYAPTDTDKTYHWTAGGWVDGLGSEFVSRDVTATDLNQTNFVRNSAWHIDGLDLTAITPPVVPAGATAVLLGITIASPNVNDIGEIRQNATNIKNRIKHNSQVSNVVTCESHAIIQLDSNRLLDYFFNAGVNNIEVNILGWFIQ